MPMRFPRPLFFLGRRYLLFSLFAPKRMISLGYSPLLQEGLTMGMRMQIAAVVAAGLLVSAGPVGLAVAGSNGHIQETIKHAKEGIGHEKEAIKHLEEAVKGSADSHAKEALEHAKEAVKHAEESLAHAEQAAQSGKEKKGK